jgi:hypothetical protein
MHSNVPANPARGKAQGRIISLAERAPERWTADGSRSPEVDAIRIPGRSLLQILLLQQAIGHPDENESGRTQRHERHVGPDRQKCRPIWHNGVSEVRCAEARVTRPPG